MNDLFENLFYRSKRSAICMKQNIKPERHLKQVDVLTPYNVISLHLASLLKICLLTDRQTWP